MYLLPENFAFKLVSALKTEASGLGERMLWKSVQTEKLVRNTFVPPDLTILCRQIPCIVDKFSQMDQREDRVLNNFAIRTKRRKVVQKLFRYLKHTKSVGLPLSVLVPT